jgi:hypothetical protein
MRQLAPWSILRPKRGTDLQELIYLTQKQKPCSAEVSVFFFLLAGDPLFFL